MANVRFGIVKETGESEGRTHYGRVYTSDLFSDCLKEWYKEKYTFPKHMISVYELDEDGLDVWVAEIDMRDVIK